MGILIKQQRQVTDVARFCTEFPSGSREGRPLLPGPADWLPEARPVRTTYTTLPVGDSGTWSRLDPGQPSGAPRDAWEAQRKQGHSLGSVKASRKGRQVTWALKVKRSKRDSPGREH